MKQLTIKTDHGDIEMISHGLHEAREKERQLSRAHDKAQLAFDYPAIAFFGQQLKDARKLVDTLEADACTGCGARSPDVCICKGKKC